MSGTVRIVDWRPFHKGALLGFAKVEMPSGLIVNDVTICTGPNGSWASPPGKLLVGRDGAVMKDGSGKARYVAVIEFASKDVRTRWSDAVIAAMRATHPEVFADAEMAR